MGSDPDVGTTVSVPLTSDQSLSHWVSVSDEAPRAPTTFMPRMPRPQQSCEENTRHHFRIH